jgi:hypothetical protein
LIAVTVELIVENIVVTVVLTKVVMVKFELVNDQAEDDANIAAEGTTSVLEA